MTAWRNPINAQAIQEGRGTPPAPPQWVNDELTTRAVNHFLGTHYTVNEIMELPSAWLDKMMLLVQSVGT